MPILIHCSDLQPQMRLAEAFRYNGRVMLPGGKFLSNDDLDSLRHRFPDVTLKIGDPVLDAMVSFEDDSHDADIADKAQSQVTKTLTDVQQRFGSRTDISTVNFQAMRDAAQSVIDYIKSSPVSAALLKKQTSTDNYLADHSGAVFYLSIVLGSAIRGYVVEERRRQTRASTLNTDVAMDLTPLGLGAMFMDIAMYALPQVFKPDYVLTPEDREKVRTHPIVGADMLPDSLPPGVKMIARSHHENYDGTGYPDAVPGKKLHIFTRIVRICDAYSAVTSARVYRQAKSPARALWEMRHGPTSRNYDPVLMKVFQTLIQPFPIGARIRLSDSRYAVVTRYNRHDPFRPQILIAFDAQGTRLSKEEMGTPYTLGEGPRAHLKLANFAGEDLGYLSEARMTEADTPPPDWSDITTPLQACYP